MDAKDLKSVPLFASLRDDELGWWPSRRTKSTCPRASSSSPKASSPTSSSRSEGTADVSKDGTLVATLGPGEFFGEMGLTVTDRRIASVVATSPMRLVVLTGAQFRAIESRMPTVGAQIRAAIQERSKTVA